MSILKEQNEKSTKNLFFQDKLKSTIKNWNEKDVYNVEKVEKVEKVDNQIKAKTIQSKTKIKSIQLTHYSMNHSLKSNIWINQFCIKNQWK